MHRRNSSLLIFASLIITCMSASADTASTLFAKLERLQAIHASFEQQSAQDPEVHTGRLWIDKPNRFRIVTETPWQQTLVSDGMTFWNYDVDLEQVIISPMEHDLLKFPILLFSSTAVELDETFSVSEFADEQNTVYVLEPRGEQQFFTQMTIEFNGDKPKTISIVDSMAQRTEIRLSEPDITTRPSPDLFHFVAPNGTDIVDQRPVTGDSKLPHSQ